MMVADALVPCLARISATIVLTIRDLHEEGFQLQPAMSHASEGQRNRLLTFVNAEIILPGFEFRSRKIIHQHASATGDYIQRAYIGKNFFIENFKELPKPNLMNFLYILGTSKTSWFREFQYEDYQRRL